MADSAPAQRIPWWQALYHGLTRPPRASAQHVLRLRSIYVLPSAAGCALAATLLVFLVASINFQLNLGYALTFLLAGSALASLWMAQRNLRGVCLRLGTLQPIYQGQRAIVPVLLHGATRTRHGLSLAMQRSQGPLAWVHADIAPGAVNTVELGSVFPQRGWHHLPSVVVECRFPLGIFRLWSHWQPDSRVLVYPLPETPMPPIRWREDHDPGHVLSPAAPSGEYDGVRSYQRGDPLRSMVWKKAATALATGSGELVVRNAAAPQPHTVWLDARATGLSHTEAQITRLTAWVLHAHQQQWQWGLTLASGLQIAPASGPMHLHTCLHALAVDGHVGTAISSTPRAAPWH